MLVLNGGYIYNNELLERLSILLPELDMERLLPEDVSLSFEDLTNEERNQYYERIRLADGALQCFRCQIQLKRFAPAELPALYTLSKAITIAALLGKSEGEQLRSARLRSWQPWHKFYGVGVFDALFQLKQSARAEDFQQRRQRNVLDCCPNAVHQRLADG